MVYTRKPVAEQSGLSGLQRILLLALGLAYWVVWMAVAFYRPPFAVPDWWLRTLGVNDASVLVWAQLDHAVNLLLAAIPFAAGIVSRVGGRWAQASALVACAPTLLMILDVARKYWIVSGLASVDVGVADVLSDAVDTLKPWLALYLLAFVGIGVRRKVSASGATL